MQVNQEEFYNALQTTMDAWADLYPFCLLMANRLAHDVAHIKFRIYKTILKSDQFVLFFYSPKMEENERTDQKHVHIWHI